MRISISLAYFIRCGGVRLLPMSLLSHLLCHYNISPAYLVVTGSAPVSSDGGASWRNYILKHLSNSFIPYALRLTMLLGIALTLGLWLQTTSPLNSPLIIYDLLDDFIIDGIIYYFAFNT